MPRRWAAALALVLASGCMDFERVSGPDAQKPDVVVLLQSMNPGPGTARDTLSVGGAVYNARGVSFTDESLRIGGWAIAPVIYPGDRWGYADTLLFSPGTLAQPVRVTLPSLAGEPLVLQEFQFLSAARRGPDTLTVRAGQDLVLPVEPGALTSGAVQPSVEQWAVYVQRGHGHFTMSATSPLPRSVVIPAALIPADTASSMVVALRSSRLLQASGNGTVHVDAEASLLWRVRIAP
ncbi:hypothetical protein [Longimicrobium sp.]|jgi:hypothetical protein|uniref:hypothetical protein n=1 Tax=Longimicrobium sp. TaxID=2029185 RepID=UPI002EDAD46C